MAEAIKGAKIPLRKLFRARDKGSQPAAGAGSGPGAVAAAEASARPRALIK